MPPKTVYEILGALGRKHTSRRDQYKQLASDSSDERARLLLNRLEELEEIAIIELYEEYRRLNPEESTYLPLGPNFENDPRHGVNCRCGPEPTFNQALECVLTSDAPLDELIDRLAGSSPATSVQELAIRLRELEQTRIRQIANFTRDD